MGLPVSPFSTATAAKGRAGDSVGDGVDSDTREDLAMSCEKILARGGNAISIQPSENSYLRERWSQRKLFKKNRCQAGWNKNVLFGFS
ncbi:MAG: hypothetical protein ACLT47_08950 [Sutterella wadsworthensis]